VAIYRIMQQRAFSPEDVWRLSEAYEAALKVLKLPSRTDPVTETVAKRIIEAAERGITDPAKLCAEALKNLDLP
jgi:formiminotetrahydrofolate cyclodeaminase